VAVVPALGAEATVYKQTSPHDDVRAVRRVCIGCENGRSWPSTPRRPPAVADSIHLQVFCLVNFWHNIYRDAAGTRRAAAPCQLLGLERTSSHPVRQFDGTVLRPARLIAQIFSRSGASDPQPGPRRGAAAGVDNRWSGSNEKAAGL